MAQNWNDKNGKFNPVSAMDYLPREQLRFIQSQRLSAMVEHAYENVALYRERMDAKGVKPSDIKSIDDISKLPFTQKTDRQADCRRLHRRRHGRLENLRHALPAHERNQ